MCLSFIENFSNIDCKTEKFTFSKALDFSRLDSIILTFDHIRGNIFQKLMQKCHNFSIGPDIRQNGHGRSVRKQTAHQLDIVNVTDKQRPHSLFRQCQTAIANTIRPSIVSLRSIASALTERNA